LALFFLHRDRIRDAKTADVQRVATTYFLPDNRTLGLYIPTAGPKRAPAPVMVDVAPLVKDYKGEAAMAAGEAFDATPANIEARTQRLKLADGMRVALLPKKTRGGIVTARLTLRFGDEKSLLGSNGVGGATATMLTRGAGGMTRGEIRAAFEKLKTRVAVGGGAARMTATIETTRENLPEVMKLVAKVARSPDFPAAELEQLRTERLTAIESERTQPENIARDALGRQGNPYPRGHVLYDRSFDEELADTRALTVEQVRAFHRDFYGADNSDFVAVGDFDDAALKAQLAELFGGWKSARPYTRIPTPLYAVAPAELRIETPDRANAYFVAQVHLPLRDDAPDYAAVLVANRVVGSVSSSVLYNRIRTREGISYGVGSTLAVGSHEPHATWTAFAIYAPQNVKRLEAAFREEIARVNTAGFTAKELEDGKKGLLQARSLSLAQDRDLAATLSSQLELGRTMDYVAGVDRAIEAVTLDQANAAFRKYIDASKLVMIYAGDFAKGKQ
jgi:zinc protease